MVFDLRSADYSVAYNSTGVRRVEPTAIGFATKFASPTGNGIGTVDDPYNIVTAFDSLVAGDVLFLRGGVYDIPTNGLRISSKAGTEANPIIVESYPREIAILDGKNRTPNDVLTGRYPTGYGLRMTGGTDYVYIRKLIVKGMSAFGIFIGGKYNKIQGCTVHGNFLSGIQVVDNTNFYITPYVNGWNTIEDCTIFDNSDAGIVKAGYEDGDNADGITVSNGTGNIVQHNLIYRNSDDGIDAWRSNNSTVVYNVVLMNGEGLGGNGNGIKLGGNTDPASTNGIGRICHHNISAFNNGTGFDQNSGKSIVVHDNVSIANRIGYSFDRDTPVTNNISIDDFRIDYYPTNVSRVGNSWNGNKTLPGNYSAEGIKALVASLNAVEVVKSKIENELEIQGTAIDANGSTGTIGQVQTAQGDGTWLWV